MKVYKTRSGIVIVKDKWYLLRDEGWDSFINDDDVFQKAESLTCGDLHFLQSLRKQGG